MAGCDSPVSLNTELEEVHPMNSCLQVRWAPARRGAGDALQRPRTRGDLLRPSSEPSQATFFLHGKLEKFAALSHSLVQPECRLILPSLVISLVDEGNSKDTGHPVFYRVLDQVFHNRPEKSKDTVNWTHDQRICC